MLKNNFLPLIIFIAFLFTLLNHVSRFGVTEYRCPKMAKGERIWLCDLYLLLIYIPLMKPCLITVRSVRCFQQILFCICISKTTIKFLLMIIFFAYPAYWQMSMWFRTYKNHGFNVQRSLRDPLIYFHLIILQMRKLWSPQSHREWWSRDLNQIILTL